MDTSKKIVITGLGAVGPLGHDLATLAANLGRSPDETGHGQRRTLDTGSELWRMTGLDADRVVSRRLQRKLDPFTVHGMVAADMALRDSGLDAQGVPAERVGIYVGNCLGGWAYTQPELQALHTRGVAGMGPYVATAWFPAALQGQISLAHGFKGHSKTLSARDVAGLQAIGQAGSAILQGRADVVLCGASEDLSSPYMQAMLQRYRHAHGPDAAVFGGLKPSVFADGAAFLVLEEAGHARRRGAKVLCELTGVADGFCGGPGDAPEVMAQALRTAEGVHAGERLLALDGLQHGEAELVRQAALRAGMAALVPVDVRGALGNQFAVSGVTEVVLAAHALSQGGLSAQSLAGVQAAAGGAGRYAGALIQRLSPQGHVSVVGLAAA